MSHSILSISPTPAPSPGGLAGFGALCSCGYVVSSSLECLARQWGWAHADFMNRKAGAR